MDNLENTNNDLALIYSKALEEITYFPENHFDRINNHYVTLPKRSNRHKNKYVLPSNWQVFYYDFLKFLNPNPVKV